MIQYKTIRFQVLQLVFSMVALSSLYAQKNIQRRTICITVDDLPAVTKVTSIHSWNYIIDRITHTFKTKKVPAYGFVNEGKLVRDNVVSKDRVAMLYTWVNNGLDLGNHTYSHMDYNNNTLADYEAEIVKGEKITNSIYKSQRDRIKYFRHPYLHVGNTVDKKTGLQKTLARLNYVEAPVTIDNSDYIFSSAYEVALSNNDTLTAQKIGKEYVPYMMDKVRYYEQQSLALFNKNISHILLIHANSINAEYLPQLIDEIVHSGYQFVSLKEALTDPLYHTKDYFVGNGGISWIHRWAITQQKTKDFFGKEPKVSDFVMNLSGFDRE